MKIVVTGSSGGIGKATALLFLEKGHEVIGLDCRAASIEARGYTHHIADIADIHDRIPPAGKSSVSGSDKRLQNPLP